MLGMGFFPWMLGLWTTLVFPPAAGIPLVDVNGVTITIGAAVKMTGTVVSLDAVDPHFGSVGIQMIHPNGQGPLVGETFFVDPSQVIVGS